MVLEQRDSGCKYFVLAKYRTYFYEWAFLLLLKYDSFLTRVTCNSELIDTFFIVIHKKPLILLHWYHHISVLLYCWHAYVTKAPAGLFFVTMNYGVHAMMYFYYFLMAVKLKPKWFNSIWITVSQISQMVVGVAVTALGFVLPPQYAKECAIKPENNAAALIMYGSYLLLFVQFFIQRYQVKGGKPKSKSFKKE
jgi:elongation of very long chain fatty acids protein 6